MPTQLRPSASDGPTRPLRAWRGLGFTLLTLALWAIAVPYSARPLGLTVATRPIVEVVDHVVPGLVVLMVGAAATIIGRLRLEAALLALLAALWMTGTHLPLLAQAARGEATWAAALFHSLPGIALLILAVDASLWAWREAA